MICSNCSRSILHLKFEGDSLLLPYWQVCQPVFQYLYCQESLAAWKHCSSLHSSSTLLSPAKCMQACAAGYYCPNSSTILPCPKGSFCKWYSTLPKHCPWLATCPPGSESADLSLGGFLGLMLILMVLWLAYVALSAYIRSASFQKPLAFACGHLQFADGSFQSSCSS